MKNTFKNYIFTYIYISYKHAREIIKTIIHYNRHRIILAEMSRTQRLSRL